MKRGPIILILCLIILNLAVLAFDVFWLPRTPLFAYLTLDRGAQARPSERLEARMEQKIGYLVRRQVEEAMVAQGNNVALARLRDYYRIRRISPQVATEVSSTAINITPRRSHPRAQHLVSPFGLFSSGVAGAGLYLVSLVTFAGLTIGCLFLIPKRMKVMSESLTPGWTHLGAMAAVGVLGYIILFAMAILLVTTVVGVPVALLFAIALIPMTIVGLAVVLLVLGTYIMRRFGHNPLVSPPYAVVIGVLLLFPLGLLPIVGWIITFVAAAVGFGALLVTKMGSPEGWSLEVFNENY